MSPPKSLWDYSKGPKTSSSSLAPDSAPLSPDHPLVPESDLGTGTSLGVGVGPVDYLGEVPSKRGRSSFPPLWERVTQFTE